MPAPKVRDVRKLADSRAVFELDIPLTQLPGFPADTVPEGGPVHARLVFGREQGYAMAQVDLHAQLQATCQRCLGPLMLQVQTSSPVLIVESEQEAESAPAGWETFLAPEGRLTFEALAAEELLLALPIVPLHDQAAQCRPLVESPPGELPAQQAAQPSAPEPVAHEEAATTRPFADLRTLLERGADRKR